MIVWAIDPGGYDAKTKSTGLAVLRGRELVSVESIFGATIFSRIMNAADDASRGLMLKPDVVVYEGWRSPPIGQGGSPQTTAQTIGAIRAACDWCGIEPVEQLRTQKTAGIARMGRFGIEHTGKNQHARDAETHGWYYVLRQPA